MPFKPQRGYNDWKTTLEMFPIDKNTSLIGHSCGGGFLLKWLSQNDVKINNLVLVAPWLDPAKEYGNFLSCTLDPLLAERVKTLHIFSSSDEFVEGVTETVRLVSQTYPSAALHTFDTMGHFCLGQMGTEKLPALGALFE